MSLEGGGGGGGVEWKGYTGSKDCSNCLTFKYDELKKKKIEFEDMHPIIEKTYMVLFKKETHLGSALKLQKLGKIKSRLRKHKRRRSTTCLR